MANKNLKVGTWNIYNGLPWGFSIISDSSRVERIIDHISNSNLDIIALQEVDNKILISNLLE